MKIKSVWGEEDKDTIKIIKATPLCGKWLNLAAGDGRYTERLLNSVDKLILADLNKNAIKKSVKKLEKHKSKIKIRAFDITKKFPFEDESFDGVFCTGTLHLFNEKKLQKIFSEINRILKLKGKIIFDFATDIKREMNGGKPYQRPNEQNYNTGSARKMLKKLLNKFNVQITESKIKPQKIKEQNKKYLLKCNFLLITGTKPIQKN